ncbi:flavin reductase family protein [Nocardia paucivorans]|uniref:flavin reductase family protein n=1 Tax=Nocardia paucivorans TaxID=114259 RepID=UPI0002EFB378|nr:flavin reductase family protein [Nocardia paucivorans]
MESTDTPAPASITPEPVVGPLELRQAMAAWTTGVAVITTSHGARPAGLVSTSFTSVSLDPPLVSWCVDRGSTSFDIWSRAEGFAVHILSADEADLVSRFARRGGDKFHGLDWRPGITGAPLLTAGIARLECRTHIRYDGGDHLILLGRVLVTDRRSAPALTFSEGALTPAPIHP